MGYEKFTKKRRHVKDQATVTVLKTGQLGINQVCHEKYFKDFKYVILYYDRESKKIGIQPTNDISNDAYNIRLSRQGKLANISAIAFIKHFKIEHNESKAYMATWNDEGKLVEVDLSTN
jgi:hypothetical protein